MKRTTQEVELLNRFWKAIWEGNAEDVKDCLRLGVPTNAKWGWGTSIETAVCARQPRIIRLLHAHGVPLVRKRVRNNPLLLAIQRECLAEARTLLSLGADVNIQNRCLETPLHYASRHGSLQAVRLLLDFGADPNVQDETGATPLERAAFRRPGEERPRDNFHRAVVISRWLLDAGADINARTHSGHTALMWASFEGNAKLVQLLLQRGADPTLRSHLYGENALGFVLMRTSTHSKPVQQALAQAIEQRRE